MNSPWTRRLAIALLCVLACAPGAMHARICLVALGAVERSACCAPASCCSEQEPAGPVLRAGMDDCHCCLALELDSNERTPILGTVPFGSTWIAAPAPAAASLVDSIRPKERQGDGLAHLCAPVPRRPAAPVPLRI